MSTMESTAPTSWKCTWSTGLLCMTDSARARRMNISRLVDLTGAGSSLFSIRSLMLLKVRTSTLSGTITSTLVPLSP